jgi:anaerobic dimethyl sulfoxide reductase subunit B (iron-sulfur subunit)
MHLGFYIDVSSCSGCKACQLACKDLHGLETGRLWRRVVEVEGGEWVRQGGGWAPTVFAYSISLSCMHCERPACVRACPTGALAKGPDGVVAVDDDACVGCRYCAWACPYGAPQFGALSGTMSKCDLCGDERAVGRPPACAAACPMRALDWGPIEDLRARYGTLATVAPLPEPSHTAPAAVLTAPRGAAAPTGGGVAIVNAEEICR